MPCTTDRVKSDLCPGGWDIECIKKDSTIKVSWDFETSKGGKIIIDPADEFTTTIKAVMGGATVATLTLLNGGHSVTGSNTLNTIFGTPLTDAVGEYTFETWWLRPATSENRPIWEGTITVVV